ncbi:hypothetical protein KP509_20G007600 [Ceratopteris richardii]|uniref:Remorin C-terminal domain-containing protein n=1 Tax=Ceratopteris richardii TaxID=49495 RepID=A0A8T2SFS9_CERRI|nr:hypothetical protein KP509_20G007600 [Ceratopteris richardii]
MDRNIALAKVLNKEKNLSHIKAWEENENSKSMNKYNKMFVKFNAWKKARKASTKAKLKKKRAAARGEENSRAFQLSYKIQERTIMVPL